MAQTEEEYLGYAEEAKNLAVDVPDVSFKDAATFVASATPVIGDAMAAKEVYDELQKDDPNYYLAGALGGAAIVGLVPGLGDAAANAIKAGARKALDVGKRIEVDPNTLGVMGGNVRLKPPVEEVTPQVSNIDYQKKMAEFDKAETADDWQNTVSEYVTESRDVNPTVRTPELEASAKDLLDGKITREKHLENVDNYKPVEAWDALPREPSSKATVFSLNTAQRKDGNFVLPDKAIKNLNVKKANLKVGDRFLGRLDIPAYKAFDTWIIAGKSPKGDAGTTYAKAIHYEGSDGKPVIFRASQGKGEKIGMGKADPAYTKATHEKTGYATVDGIVKDLDVEEIRDQAAKYLNDPEWTQVGFDPRRQGGFYARSGESKHAPVREADEVIQIGPLVLAKNAKLDMDHKGYNEGGAVMDNEPIQTEMDLILNETKDPVSGNTAPLGAKPEEVRDDVPINASPNEFMINAATRRYFGTEFFEELQKSAEEGWKRIRDGEESYFRDDELETADDENTQDTDKPINMQEGGAVPGAGITVPKPVGGGYGRYGGTGSPFMGFESKTFTNPETGQQIIIYYFNGRPMSRIPAGFREVSQDVVEEQKTVAAERGDDKEDISLESIGISDKTFRNKAVKDWTDVDFKDYNDDLANSIKKGQDPLSLTKAENAILSLVGAAIGLGGAVALPAFAKKAKEKQAEAAHIRALDLMQTSSDKNIIAAADATRYITGSALQKEDYAVSVANPFSGLYKDDDDRNIFDRFFGTQGGLDAYGEPTEEAIKQRYLDQYGTETSNYMEDPFAPPSRGVGQTLAGIKPTQPSTTAPSYATMDMGEAGRTSAPRDEKSSRLDVSNPNTSANVAEHLSDREKESLRAFPETAAHYVATANRRANEAAAGDSSNTDKAKEKSDSGGFSFSDLFS